MPGPAVAEDRAAVVAQDSVPVVFLASCFSAFSFSFVFPKRKFRRSWKIYHRRSNSHLRVWKSSIPKNPSWRHSNPEAATTNWRAYWGQNLLVQPRRLFTVQRVAVWQSVLRVLHPLALAPLCPVRMEAIYIIILSPWQRVRTRLGVFGQCGELATCNTLAICLRLGSKVPRTYLQARV